MAALSKRIRQIFNRKTPVHSAPAKTVVISDSEEESEGEQKIFGAIRSGEYDHSTCFVYGLDADLLLLGGLCLEAVSQDTNIKILRPSDGSSTPGNHETYYYVVDMRAYRKTIHAQIATDENNDNCVCSDYASEEAKRTSMREYAILCSLLGNDFIPGLACMPVSKESIESMVTIYKRVVTSYEDGNRRYLSQRHEKEIEIDFDVFERILEIVSESEDTRMIGVDRDYYSQCRAQRKRDILDVERYPLSHPFPDKIRPSEAGWRLRYYHHLFHSGDTDIVANACRNYIQGVQWSINYHCQLLHVSADPTWYYRYHYAPTALDLTYFVSANPTMAVETVFTKKKYNGLEELEIEVEKTDTQEETKTRSAKKTKEAKEARGWSDDTELQLLMVLPPSSIDLYVHRHPRAKSVAHDVTKGCVHYYPLDFKVLTYLKRYISECHPLLPDVDYSRVHRAYNAAISARGTVATTAASTDESQRVKGKRGA
jgi:5'-3' exoribonuclease 2